MRNFEEVFTWDDNDDGRKIIYIRGKYNLVDRYKLELINEDRTHWRGNILARWNHATFSWEPRMLPTFSVLRSKIDYEIYDPTSEEKFAPVKDFFWQEVCPITAFSVLFGIATPIIAIIIKLA